jgi:hypothetical protein
MPLQGLPAHLPHGMPPRHPHGVEEKVQRPHLLQEGPGLQLIAEVGGEGLSPGGLAQLQKRAGPPPGKEELLALKSSGQGPTQSPCSAGDEDAHGLQAKG